MIGGEEEAMEIEDQVSFHFKSEQFLPYLLEQYN